MWKYSAPIMAKALFKYTTDIKKNKATFILTGYISDETNNGAEFLQEFREAEKKYKNITVHIINLYGGQISQGNVIARVIKQSKSKTTTITEGISASMGVPISLAGNYKRLMIEKSRLMLHRATMSGTGNADQLRENAKLAEEMENELAEDIAGIINKDAQFVKDNWFNKGDTYLSAHEAKKAGLVHDVIPGEIENDLPEDLLKSDSLEAGTVAMFYANQLDNQHQTKQKKMEKLPLMVANLKIANPKFEAETVEAVAAEMKAQAEALVQARATNEQLAEKLQAEKNAKAVALIESALDANKITKKQEEHYLKFAKTDFDGCKAVLDEITPHVPASARMGKENNGPDPYKDFDFAKFQTEKPEELARIKAEDPDRYKALFKAQFGTEPNL